MPEHRINDPRQPAELLRFKHEQLAEACAKLDPVEERSISEEGLAIDMASWAEY
jgi:hypothetical protein